MRLHHYYDESTKKIVLVVLLITIFISSNLVKEVDYPVLSVNVTQANPPSLFDIFQKIEIIPLETTDHSLIGGQGNNTVFYNNHYYILDGLSKSFYCFDEHGKFVRKIANEGAGPYEYIYAADFIINEYNNTAELLSPFGFLYVYELSGKFVKKIRLPNVVPNYQEIMLLNDSLRILTSSVDNNQDQLYVYSTRSNTIVNSFYRENPAIFNFNNRSLCRYNDSIFYFKALVNKVFKINQHGYEIAYSWDVGVLNPETTKLDTDITNERLTDMFLNSQIKGVYNEQFQNDKYYYTLFNRSVNQNIVRTNVFYNKRDHKKYVFEKFKEDLAFFPFYWCDDYVLSSSGSFNTSKSVTLSILDEENAKKLNAMEEEDNPFIIKYYFK